MRRWALTLVCLGGFTGACAADAADGTERPIIGDEQVTTADGWIIDFDPGKDRMTVCTTDSTLLRVRLNTSPGYYGFALSHLHEHMTSREPVSVVIQSPGNTALEIRDTTADLAEPALCHNVGGNEP